jgi:hypothetical protein
MWRAIAATAPGSGVKSAPEPLNDPEAVEDLKERKIRSKVPIGYGDEQGHEWQRDQSDGQPDALAVGLRVYNGAPTRSLNGMRLHRTAA